MANGTPNSTQSTVLALEVRRLSFRAATEESELISPKKSPHSTRLSMAASGSTRNSAPTAAGAKSHGGSPT